jgi:diacylglycerol kinase
MISFHRLWKSLWHAIDGIVRIAEEEQSFRLQMLAAAVVFGLMIVMPSLEIWERVALTFMVVMVLVLEIINSIFERLADAVHPRVSPMVKEVKDMMAAAVLLTAVAAAVIGFLIFWPHMAPTLRDLWRLAVV